MHSKNKQSGFVTALSVVLLAVLWFSVANFYRSGLFTTAKIRQQNAADATAFSVANVIARDLNFMAYSNRAMIANQVAIGQMVGIVSWSRMLSETTQNLSYVAKTLSWVPGLGAVLNAMATGLDGAADALANVLDNFNRVIIPATDTLIGVLSHSQAAVHLAMQKVALETYNQISRANDKAIETGWLSGSKLFSILRYQQKVFAFTERVKANEVQKPMDNGNHQRVNEFAGLVRQSRDPFSIRRSYHWFNANLFITKVSMPKAGGTEFEQNSVGGSSQKWTWSSLDTVSLKVKVGWGWLAHTERIPFGWGAAHALSNGTHYSYRHSPKWGRAWQNNRAARLAQIKWGQKNIARIHGLRDFFDIEQTSKTVSTGPSLLVLLQKQTGQDSAIPMYALAKAQPIFVRPDDLDSFKRADGRMELGNLYNPYWQPTLEETTANERAQAIVLTKNQ